MWSRRERSGSVLCPSCGLLVGVNDEKCLNCGRLRPGMFGMTQWMRSLGKDQGFVPFVIGTCVVVYVLTLLASGGSVFGGGSLFSLLGPSVQAEFMFGASGEFPVFRAGRWWTVLSASWLHAGILHILFNMMALRQLAPAVADMYGAARMVIIYVLAGVAGFALSSVAGAYFPPLPFLRGGTFTVGASAAISGLIGAILYYGRRSGSRMAHEYATQTALMLVLYGFFMPGIDNYAHLGGFGGGYLVGQVLDPLKPEKGDHLLIALGCLAASILSIVASVLTTI
jgi:rhomboid protease GluP